MQKPQLSPARVLELLAPLRLQMPVAILAVRAYRRDTMGKPGVNDCNIYDDATFISTPAGVFNFNANTDPARIGWNAALGKPFAQLVEGVWPFILGLHKSQYLALRQPYEEQAAALRLVNVFGKNDPRAEGHFTVTRDDGKGLRFNEDGYFAINIHRGGVNGTSSWGCQTLPPEEWGDFIGTVKTEMRKAEQSWIPYCLLSGPVV